MDIFKKKGWFLIFGICFIYWTYLIFHTKMIVVFDSIDYENTGRLIYQKGWMDFFKTGPHREPLYPSLIALSMSCADFLSTNYQLILKIFQVVFLFLTQIFLIVLLRKLNIREWIIKISALYFGISPAVINATFSVYYEIVVFPFVVAAVLLASFLWFDIHQKGKYGPILGKTILFGACFSLLALGRGVFQVVFYFFILPFCISALLAFFKRRGLVLRRLLIFVSIAFLIFSSAVSCVKTMNLRHNGQYVLCQSHLYIFLASAYKHTQSISPRIIASNIAMIPGTGVCRMFFSKKECDDADWYGIMRFDAEVAQKLAAIPKDRQEPGVVRLVLEKAMDRPLEYIFFSVVEALKMPFWESTKIGFVSYPGFLTKLYDHPIVRFGLRLFFGFLTIAAFVFVTFDLWRVKRRYFSAIFFVWLMIAAYTFCYSLCVVLTRYALPIASMYIVCISFTVNVMLYRKNFNE